MLKKNILRHGSCSIIYLNKIQLSNHKVMTCSVLGVENYLPDIWLNENIDHAIEKPIARIVYGKT